MASQRPQAPFADLKKCLLISGIVVEFLLTSAMVADQGNRENPDQIRR